MCRMIAAVGRFEVDPLLEAIRSMAMNDNPAYDHEKRVLGGDALHDCGWGAAFLTCDGLSVRRSTVPCFLVGELEGLRSELRGLGAAGAIWSDEVATPGAASSQSGILLLHARRTVRRDTIAIRNTHPFRARWKGMDFAFCHNGDVRDLSQLSWDAGLSPEGSIDSERLFLHALTRFDPDRPAAAVAAALAPIRDFTCINSILIAGGSAIAYARMAPDSSSPRYYKLWRGVGEGIEVVSSEIVDGLDVEWETVADGTALVLRSTS